MQYFRVTKWGKFQHYHQPRPPWLKLYTKINDPGETNDWRHLKDHELGQIIRIAVHAALNNNTLPYDAQLIQDTLECDQHIDLANFAQLGLIEVFSSYQGCLSREKSRVLSRENARKNPKDPSSEIRDQSSEDRDITKPKKTSPAVRMNDLPARAHSAARTLAQFMLANDPNAKIPATATAKLNWLDAIDKLNRLDKRTWSEIDQVIRWSQQDDFWKTVILSGPNLRKQFSKMLLKMNTGNGKSVEDKNKKFLEDYRAEVEQS